LATVEATCNNIIERDFTLCIALKPVMVTSSQRIGEKMAKTKQHFKFNIGDRVITLEDGGGYGAPIAFDHVTMCVRRLAENGKPGAREAVHFGVRRTEIAAIGMSFLNVAANMAPETIWARSEIVASAGAQQRPVVPLSLEEGQNLTDYLAQIDPKLVRDPLISFDKLRKRMPTLQRAQFLLERVDDDVAQQIDILLALVEQTGALPVRFELVPIPAEGLMPDAAPHGRTH
jgi:hypothetical protein